MAKQDDIAKLTFEQALARLEALVQSIEQGKIGLQDAIQRYEEGTRLVHRCRTILRDAEQKIQTLQLSADGQLTTAPFAPPSSGEPENS